MKKKRLLIVSLLVLVLGTWAQAGKGGPKGGGGSGGGNPSTETTFAAEVTIDDRYALVSDSWGSYTDGFDGVSAEFPATRNLLFKTGNVVREAIVDLGSCMALTDSGEYDETAALLAQQYFTILGMTPKVQVDASGQSVPDSFFGLAVEDFGFADLGIGLVPPADNRAWSIRFDPLYGGDMAVVERLSEVDWVVDTLVYDGQGGVVGSRRAAIVRPPKKGKGQKVIVATCDPLSVRFAVTCDLDGDGACDAK